MSKILNTLSAIGALAMAATPLLAVGSIAHAETGVHIRVADLDLSRQADAATFRHRVDTAARSFCAARGEGDMIATDGCRQAIREEAVSKLGDEQRAALRTASVSAPTAWSVASR